jgi:hypothetical protein
MMFVMSFRPPVPRRRVSHYSKRNLYRIISNVYVTVCQEPSRVRTAAGAPRSCDAPPSDQRFRTILMLTFGVCATMLAGAGVFGVTLQLSTVGIGLGLLGALWVTRLPARQLPFRRRELGPGHLRVRSLDLARPHPARRIPTGPTSGTGGSSAGVARGVTTRLVYQRGGR